MGGGSWTLDKFKSYTIDAYTSKGISATTFSSSGIVLNDVSNQDIFVATTLDPALDPRRVMRECRDSEEHPFTKPVIIGCDTTGSMGDASVEVAKKLNVIMTDLYEKVKDVEFCIMGIGDLAYDHGPIQISQFESDIRIAEQLDKVWFEFGGGGNSYESYTAAWYMGSRHCDLDCWKRGEKGIIITIGDERLNPYLPATQLSFVTGDTLQGDIETKDLYDEVTQKYDVYHIQVNHGNRWDYDNIVKSWEMLGNHYKEANLDNITQVIVDIITNNNTDNGVSLTNDGISW